MPNLRRSSNNYTFNYSYNLGGQLSQANYVAPSFNKNVNYAYNGKGALTGIGTNLLGSDANVTTNVISAMTYQAFGAASSVSYGYDGNGKRVKKRESGTTGAKRVVGG